MENIKLRAMEPTDVDAIFVLENCEDIARASWNNAPVSHHQLVNYAYSYSSDMFRDGELRLVVEASGRFAGTVDITDIDAANGHALIGVAIVAELRRQGIGRAAVGLAAAYCLNAGLHQLCAIVARDNAPSLALFASAGFSANGRLRSWLRRGKSYVDALILQKIL